MRLQIKWKMITCWRWLFVFIFGKVSLKHMFWNSNLCYLLMDCGGYTAWETISKLFSNESSHLCPKDCLISKNTWVLTCLALVFVMVSEIGFFLSFTVVLENNSSNSWQSMDGSSIFSQISEALESLKLSKRPVREPSNQTARHHGEHGQNEGRKEKGWERKMGQEVRQQCKKEDQEERCSFL